MKISNKSELGAAIITLEKRKLLLEAEMADQFKAVRESLNPMTLIKNGIGKLTAMPFAGGILKTAAGLGVGILSKKLLMGRSSSIVNKIAGPVLEFFVAKTAINNVDKIKAYGTSIYHNLFKKNHNHTHKETEKND